MSTWSRWREGWRSEALAIVTDDGQVTYGELVERVHRAIGWLRAAGIGRGDVLALQMPRCTAFLELHLAALAMGATTLPLNDRYTRTEVAFFLRDSGASLAVITDELSTQVGEGRVVSAAGIRGQLDAAEPGDPGMVADDEVAVLCYTSGTTGRPKGARILHRNLQATVDALHEAWRWTRSDVLLHALPLYHVHGLFVAQHGALRAGATAVWLSRFTADGALGALERHRGTIFMGVPTFYHRFLQYSGARPDLSHVRLFTSGSAPLPAAVHRDFEGRFGHRILERYGMTEVGIVLSNPYDGERRPGSVGGPLPGVRARITDPETGLPTPVDGIGEIRIAGPSVFAGYLGLPEKTHEAIGDGWMRTGDLGRRDADGYFHVVGRAKDLIISGGLNVYPREVEATLLEHPSVAESAVIGVSDPDFGERVVAVVVVAGAWPGDAALDQWCRTRLAPYKCPRRFVVREALPRNSMGKVEKAALRREIG